ncbi:hypothetical protein L596_019751 [Steinernema carpocapsae]|uniref:Uncharacterized protein n=1 Tax=Steinernema carpocapsae TaxID=34508 RepID=A0A4U5MRH3_STECR|nr:hypothetical protein L596_019751 [Steinernema carpocapsae]
MNLSLNTKRCLQNKEVLLWLRWTVLLFFSVFIGFELSWFCGFLTNDHTELNVIYDKVPVRYLTFSDKTTKT